MSKEFTAVSLFTGAGGMDVGFERAGIKVVFANELMKEAAQTYNANHPAGVMVNDDVNNVMDQLSQFEVYWSRFLVTLWSENNYFDLASIGVKYPLAECGLT